MITYAHDSGDVVDFGTENPSPVELAAPAQLSIPSSEHHGVHKSLSDASLMHQVKAIRELTKG